MVTTCTSASIHLKQLLLYNILPPFSFPYVLKSCFTARCTLISQFKNHGDANICTMHWSESLQMKIKAFKAHRGGGKKKTRLASKNMKFAEE